MLTINVKNNMKFINNKSTNDKVSNTSVIALKKSKEALEKQLSNLKAKTTDKKISSDGQINITGEKDLIETEIKNIQTQIAEIDRQIAEAQREKISKLNSDTDNDENTESKNESGNFAENIISVSGNLKSVKFQYSIKKNMENQSKVLDTEIKLDKQRGVNTKKKEKELSNIKEGISRIEDNISSKLKNINKKVSDKDKYIDEIKEDLEEIDKAKSTDNQGLKGNIVDKKI